VTELGGARNLGLTGTRHIGRNRACHLRQRAKSRDFDRQLMIAFSVTSVGLLSTPAQRAASLHCVACTKRFA
jgi:hypothetical protein